jgi:hypothetical protein
MTIERLEDDIAELRLEVTRHPLFFRHWSVETLRTVMTHHVMAVWDFMALTKTLQRGLTCMDVPWMPPADPVCARMINEIVLAEESDQIESLGFTGSHFELYLAAMDEVGAQTDQVERFLAAMATGTPIVMALERSLIPAASQRFVRHTLHMSQKSLHEVAASFLFGREDIIPEMFSRVLPLLPASGCGHFRAYLERHIVVDGDIHRPMARKMLQSLCGKNERRWQEASDAALSSLAARRRLWDDALQAVDECQIGHISIVPLEESQQKQV